MQKIKFDGQSIIANKVVCIGRNFVEHILEFYEHVIRPDWFYCSIILVKKFCDIDL